MNALAFWNSKFAKQADMGNTSLYGNRALIRIGGRSQSRRRRDSSMSKPDFQIRHQGFPFVGQSTRFFDFCYAVADLFFGGVKLFFGCRFPAMLLRTPLLSMSSNRKLKLGTFLDMFFNIIKNKMIAG